MPKFAVYELLVAGSTLLAVLPVGCSVGYPSVLLRQLSSNDSSIQLDWDTSSWIGSIHGLAGIPSIIMPAIMQWRGRKLAFILACLVSIIGWIIAFTATTATSILISESIHGFGSQSIMAIGMLNMSEMLSPRIRSTSMCFYLVMQTLGMALVGIIGSYLHWRTVTLVICAPLVIVMVLAACTWPESPAWLAHKGEFDKCAKAFTLLRGTGDLARAELEELILAQKENLSQNKKQNKRSLLKYFWKTLMSRDFYLPAIHMFIYLESLYWTGGFVTMIYTSDVIQRATFTKDTAIFGNIALNIAMFIGSVTTIIMIRYLKPKKVYIVSMFSTAVILFIGSAINYSQNVDMISKESYVCLYMLIVFIYVNCLGLPIVLTVAAELMPVKHRGIGGPLYVIFTCILHTSSMKSSPYLFKYLNLWGTWILYAINGITCCLLIWKYIPETKGRTLQQLEDYYNYGNIDKCRRFDAEARLNELTH